MDKCADSQTLRASQGFSISQVRAFIAAAESRSIGKAAIRLCVSQPALSRSIREMETAVGCGLFVRSRQGVILSEAGEAMLPQARRLMEAYEGAVAFVSGRRNGRPRTLRLAAGASMAPVVAGEVLRQLQLALPHSDMQMTAKSSEEAVNDVLCHRADFALCSAMEGHPELRYTPVLQAPFGLIVPPGCAMPEAIASLDDLRDVPIVRLADYTPVTRLLRRNHVHFPRYFESPVVFSCLSAAFDLMRAQHMVAVATAIGASMPQLKDMRFMALPRLLPEATVHLVSLRSLVQCDAIELMRDAVRQGVHCSPWRPEVTRLNSLPCGV